MSWVLEALGFGLFTEARISRSDRTGNAQEDYALAVVSIRSRRLLGERISRMKF